MSQPQQQQQQLQFDRKFGVLFAVHANEHLEPIGMAYSGDRAHFNMPTFEQRVQQGPIPAGTYLIKRTIAPAKGPICFNLLPFDEATRQRLLSLGRSGFMIHWDNHTSDFTASEGCIVCVQPATFSRIEDGAVLVVV